MKTRSPLFLPLVIGIFIIIIATYVPVFATRITSIGKEVKGDAHGTFGIVKDQFNKAGFLLQKDSLVPVRNEHIPFIKRTDDTVQTSTQEGLPSSRVRSIEKDAQEDPAKTFCVRKGGFVQEREGAAGSRYAACLFNDGSECETYQFSKNTCHIGQYRVAEDGMEKLKK